jgi:DNA-binding NtrC family response regulator
MDKPQILLINLNQGDTESEVKRLLGRHCQLTCLSDADAIPEKIQVMAPQAICFEYDYPDIPRLAALQETKLGYPSLPIVMVTKQHSEDLAVWAFRSRVWDYFIKPLPISEVLKCFKTIQALPPNSNKMHRGGSRYGNVPCRQTPGSRLHPDPGRPRL